MDKSFIQALAQARFEVLEAEHRAIVLQRQLDAAEVMIRTLTRRLAEREFKDAHTGTVGSKTRHC